MAYQSLYRKYRSQTFGDLIGQDHVVRTLQNAIASGRIAHAYLFTGPRGTGKTSTARLLAKALCCVHGPTPNPDNTCEICEAITIGACVDVVEIDAASESNVESVRENIVETVEYRPMMARYKVFIIDEVHDLSAKAFDALLKTIEEPPPHIIFILATTEYNKVPPTIRSRCQKFEFHRASMADLVSRLGYVAEHEGVQAEPAALAAIARMADGGYRDALTLLEQAILTSADGRITLQQVYDQLGLVPEETVDRLLLAMRDVDVPAVMELLGDVARLGRDPRAILESMLVRLADLTRASYQIEVGAGDATREAALHETAARLGRDLILRLRAGLAEAHKVIRDITLPRLWLEAELVRLATWSVIPSSSSPPPPPAASTPAPVRPAPKPTAPSEAAPTPEAAPAVPAETPESAPMVAASGTGAAPERRPGPADELWPRVIAAVGQQSKTLAMKLNDTQIAGNDGSRLVVEFSKASMFEWLEERPKAKAVVWESIKAHYGTHYVVEYRLNKRDSGTDEPTAVELPAEGARLEQLAREVFGVDNQNGNDQSSNP